MDLSGIGKITRHWVLQQSYIWQKSYGLCLNLNEEKTLEPLAPRILEPFYPAKMEKKWNNNEATGVGPFCYPKAVIGEFKNAS